MARFRALQRLYDSFEPDLTSQRLAFGRRLAMVAEHTWGVDIKTYLRDETAWDRTAFQAARAGDFRFAYAEQSWAEQRAYIDAAVAELAPVDRLAADAAIADPNPDMSEAPSEGATLRHGGWSAALDPRTGDIAMVTAPDGRSLSGLDGSLIGYRYESYDWTELQRHLDTYLQHRLEWAILDHDKPGLDRAETAITALFKPISLGNGWGEMDPMAHVHLGAARRHRFSIRPLDANRVEIALTLLDKPANRMPEAGFITLTPGLASAWSLRKMGLWHQPGNIVKRGGGQLQTVEAVRCKIEGVSLQAIPLDAPLVGAASAPFMPFQPEPPDYSAGIRFNIHNNKWGTNFPMWCEGTFTTRLVLEFS